MQFVKPHRDDLRDGYGGGDDDGFDRLCRPERARAQTHHVHAKA